jgi:hypothetical protein
MIDDTSVNGNTINNSSTLLYVYTILSSTSIIDHMFRVHIKIKPTVSYTAQKNKKNCYKKVK